MAGTLASIAGKCTALGLGAALGLCGVAHAQYFKCVDADGSTAFQSVPCSGAGKEQRLSVSPAAVYRMLRVGLADDETPPS